LRWEGSSWRIVRTDASEAIHFEFIASTGAVELSLDGSTDTLCEPPWMVLLDVDGDGHDDVYFHHCGGHGYVSHGPPLTFVSLGQFDPADAPALHTWWFQTVTEGGLPWLPVGAALLLAGLVSGLVRRRIQKSDPSDKGLAAFAFIDQTPNL
jgi:hypothetical protein